MCSCTSTPVRCQQTFMCRYNSNITFSAIDFYVRYFETVDSSSVPKYLFQNKCEEGNVCKYQRISEWYTSTMYPTKQLCTTDLNCET